MRNNLALILLSILFLLSSLIFAQTPPEGINYQAVVRNAAGVALNSQNVNVNFIIHKDSANGTIVFNEFQSTTTNQFGLINLQIGSTNPTDFSTISWGVGTHFLQVRMNDGSGFVGLGTTQFVSVPYAFHAKTAESILNVDTGWTLNGSSLYPTTSTVKVGIGTRDPSHQLTVNSNDSIVANFHGNDANVTGITVSNNNTSALIGIALITGSGDSGIVAINPSKNRMNITNTTSGGKLLFDADSTIALKSDYFGSEAKKIVNLSDSIISTSILGATYHRNVGTFSTDHLHVLGTNPGLKNSVLTNDGFGVASWQDPLWKLDSPNISFNTGNVGIGTANPLQLLTLSAPFSTVLRFERSNSTAFDWEMTTDGFGFHLKGGADSTGAGLIDFITVDGNGKVGIGENVPTQTLDLVGNIQVTEDYIYKTPKQHYMSFSPTVFNSMIPDSYDYGTFNAASLYCYFRTGVRGNIGYATANINLPDGAIVTELKAWLYDNDMSTIQSLTRVSLMEQKLGAENILQMASVQTGGTSFSSTSVQELNTTSISQSTIDNSLNSYHLRFDGEQGNQDTRLYGVRITYTVNQAD